MIRGLVVTAVAVTMVGCSQTETKAPESAAFILRCDGQIATISQRSMPTPHRQTWRIDPDAKTISQWNPEGSRFVSYTEINPNGQETVEVTPASITVNREEQSEEGNVTSTIRFDRTLGTAKQQTNIEIPNALYQVVFEANCVKVTEPPAPAF